MLVKSERKKNACWNAVGRIWRVRDKNVLVAWNGLGWTAGGIDRWSCCAMTALTCPGWQVWGQMVWVLCLVDGLGGVGREA